MSGGTILAKHKSLCPRCRNWILPELEEEIVEVDGEWCHRECVPDDDQGGEG